MTPQRHATYDVPTWLRRGQIELVGRIAGSWNHVFLARIEDGQAAGLAIYKPRDGEYPLWDFADGTLYRREMAAYELSRALGWPAIPPTLVRDGPFGVGMVQQFVESDSGATYFALRDDRLEDLLPIALFDHLTNNADRKGGHLVLDRQGLIWAIDHALTFHPQPKLRTVIWDFAGEEIPAEYMNDLGKLDAGLAPGETTRNELESWISAPEMSALQERLQALLASGRFPHPDPGRVQMPWPLI